MLKYENLIHRLDLKQKALLLTTPFEDKNRTIDNYDLPIFNLKTVDDSVKDIVLPNYKAMAQTLNKRLIERLGVVASNIHRAAHDNVVIASPQIREAYSDLTFSSSKYISTKCSTAFSKAIEKNDSFSYIPEIKSKFCIEEDYRIYLKNIESVIKNSKPSLVVLDSPFLCELLDEWGYRGIRAAKCNDEEDIVIAISRGCHLVITALDAQKIICDAVDSYEVEKTKLLNGELEKEYFDSDKREGKILDPSNIDSLLDELIGFLVAVDDYYDTNYTFDSEDVSNLLYEAQCESLVLLKNNNVLPIERHKKIGFIGDLFKKGTNEKLDTNIFDELGNFDIDVTGYAHGYVYDDEVDGKLIERAMNLAKESDYVIVYVGNMESDENHSLSHNQIELLKSLKNCGRKVVAFLNTTSYIDMSFIDYVDAAIYTCGEATATGKALIGILTGDVNPSGRLSFNLSLKNDIFKENYGLSYTEFEYSYERIDRKGMSICVKNVGSYAGFATLKMVIHSPNIDEPFTKGFEKVYLKPGQTERVEFEFDENTFIYYDVDKELYGIFGGEYQIDLIDSNNLYATKTIKIEQKYFGLLPVSTNELYEESFIEDNIVSVVPLFFKRKLTLAILCFIYYNTMLSFILYYNINNDNNIILFVILGVLYLVLNLIFVIYVVKLAKKKKLSNVKDDVNLEAYVNNLPLYNVVYKESFVKPVEEFTNRALEENPLYEEETPVEEVKDEEKEEQAVEEIVEPKEEKYDYDTENSDEEEEYIEEVPVKPYVTDALGNEIIDTLEYNDKLDYSNMALRFVEFAKTKDIIVDYESSRAVFAAMAASHIIFVRFNDLELKENFFSLLSEFLDNKELYIKLTINNTINSFHDLIWKNTENNYEPTEFMNFLLNARGLLNHFGIVELNNVNVNNINSYYKPFIDYSFRPNIERHLKLELNDIDYIIPKNIYTFIPVMDRYYLEDLSQRLVISSVQIDVNIRKNEIPIEINYNKEYISHEKFIEDVRLGTEDYFIEEEEWKKLDEFEDSIKLYDPKFKIDNKTATAIESMSALLLANEADMDDVNDLVLCYKVIGLIKNSSIYKKENGEKIIEDLLDKYFSKESIQRAIKLLAKPLLREDIDYSLFDEEIIEDDIDDLEESQEDGQLEEASDNESYEETGESIEEENLEETQSEDEADSENDEEESNEDEEDSEEEQLEDEADSENDEDELNEDEEKLEEPIIEESSEEIQLEDEVEATNTEELSSKDNEARENPLDDSQLEETDDNGTSEELEESIEEETSNDELAEESSNEDIEPQEETVDNETSEELEEAKEETLNDEPVEEALDVETESQGEALEEVQAEETVNTATIEESLDEQIDETSEEIVTENPQNEDIEISKEEMLAKRKEALRKALKKTKEAQQDDSEPVKNTRKKKVE